ncbi:ribonuclease domain-containing protein [Pseudonocardia spinosispora]|uniref:ribonuclease domain-containing protein n=1 Tax=Pseudonocardia spinosispora TaxID=103441 RepID=UPI000419CC43|nr:ribonuclease domain-containing protein [Pseudonocardia spinosispora]
MSIAGGRLRTFWLVLGLLGLLGAVLLGCSSPTSTPSASTAQSSAKGGCPAPSKDAPGAAASKLKVQSLCALPPEAAQVWHTIETGGKFAYSRDGIVFNNAEKRLPLEARGYYHEYTVPTPGSKDRGARRLITGQEHELYYTADHYSSFVVVDAAATG